MLAHEALNRFISLLDHGNKVLDIGAGAGEHTRIMRQHGLDVVAIDLHRNSYAIQQGVSIDVVRDYMDYIPQAPLDGIWCSHVLEHQLNINDFLKKCFRDLKPDGLLAITVPPLKHQVVGGHLSLWNEGILLYNLILAGFDCKEASVGVYGYNISVIVRKTPAELPELDMDNGDIDRLAPFFPLVVRQGFNGRTGNIRWGDTGWIHPTYHKPKVVTLIALGPSQQEYFHRCLESNPPPEVTEVDEIWTVNRGGLVFKHDLLWVMDHIQGEAESAPNYGKELLAHRHPIITSDTASAYNWLPHIHEYPFEQIETWLRDVVRAQHYDWFHNSVAYMIVYAGFIGVEEIRIWGADYSGHYSGVVEDGHPNVAYWVGIMEQMGLVVKPVSSSSFLGANRRDRIYGYRDDPRERARARRAEFEQIRKNYTF